MPTPVRDRPRPPWPREALRGRRPIPDLDALPGDEAERVRARLHSLDTACGCAIGAAVAVGASAVYAAGAALWFGWLADSTWTTIAVGAGVFVLGAGTGKTLGLMRARSQRDRLLDNVYARVAGQDVKPASG